ncbi:hypothetical protein BSKO_12276 [Bryopsis sp. KO-2023]|nr:hypothetical protein BSKO_12276 [Bryopsis sp. KO-2023]
MITRCPLSSADLVLSLPALKHLRFSDNAISEIPVELAEVKCLSTMIIDGNQVKSLPKALLSHPTLRSLMCSFNELEELPTGLSTSTILQALILQDNHIAKIPDDFDKLIGLRALSFENNRLASIPDALGSLVHLKLLDLSGNQLATIPSSLSNLERLSSFRCANNLLSTTPEFLYSLTTVADLDLTGNLIPEISTPALSTSIEDTASLLEELRPFCTSSTAHGNDGIKHQIEDGELRMEEEESNSNGWDKVRTAVGLPEDPFIDRTTPEVPKMDLPTIMAMLGGGPPAPAPERNLESMKRPQTRATFRRITQQTLAAVEQLHESLDIAPDGT